MHRILIPLTATLLAIAPAALANHHEAGEKGAEHRSDKAADKSNAQWSDDAQKGQERAEDVHPDTKAKADAAAKARDDAAAKAKAKAK